MPLSNENSDGLQRYIDLLDQDIAYPPRNSKEFEIHVDEIRTFILLTYGQKIADSFVELIDNSLHYEMQYRRLRAFLLSLSNKQDAYFRSDPKKKEIGSSVDKKLLSNSVFIVHGHDDEAKESVARFISKLGLEPIILHERPNSGKTIIEKLESNAEEISFAVVLLTPDDKGASAESSVYKYRARQNVIYELGFFNAKLGRDKVCVLKKEDVEVLSDYLGVVYADMDKNGGWKNQLARELKGAGLQVSSENVENALLA